MNVCSSSSQNVLASLFFSTCDRITSISENLYKVSKNCRSGVARKDGMVVLPIEQDHIIKISNDFLLVWKGDKCGIFSMKVCRMVISLNCDYIVHRGGYTFRIWRGGKSRLVSVRKQQKAPPFV